MNLNQEVLLLIALALAFIITYLSIPTLVKVAKAKNLYDVPDSRKSHTNHIPTLGGLAIFAGLVVSLCLFFDFAHTEIKYILAALTIIFFIGVKDDILVTAPDKKLIGEVFAAIILTVLGNIRITSLHGFAGMYDLPYAASILLSIFVILVVLNGFNLIDGIDGLASAVGIISALAFGIWFYMAGHVTYAVLSFALIGGLIAFFRFNIYNGSYKIFMGDTGSLIIGLVLSVLAIQFNEFNAHYTGVAGFKLYNAPAISFGILIVPLFDTLRVFIIRVLQKRSPFTADKNHVHHKLLMLGFSHVSATTRIAFVNILYVAMVFAMDGLGIGSIMISLLVSATLISFVPVFILKSRQSYKPIIQRSKDFSPLTKLPVLQTNGTKKVLNGIPAQHETVEV